MQVFCLILICFTFNLYAILIGDEILDTKTIERSLVKRQAIVKSSFAFPSPPFVNFNGKRITFVETLVTSDTTEVDVDSFSGGIGKDRIILIVTAYNAQVFNVRVTVYGINVK